MKKVWQTLLLLCSVTGALCAFAACGGGGNNKRKDDASLHQHVLARYNERASTCYYKGTKEHYKCIWCNKLFFDESGEKEATIEELATELLPHTEEIDAAVKPTCTVNGYTEGRHCSVCNAVLAAREIIPAGHTVVIDKAVAVTCTTDGKTEGKHCSTCNTVFIEQETIPATGHTVVTDGAVAATCTKSGTTAGRHCSVCGVVLEGNEIIPATGHTEVDDEAVEVTCTTDGKTAGKHCSVCNTVLIEQEVISAGHKWNIDNECTVCGYALNHTAGLSYRLNDDGNSYMVMGIGSAAGDIVIPAMYHGKPVTAIGNEAFARCDYITSIYIPNSVADIGESAIFYCSALRSITLPNSLKAIGSWAIYHCDALKSVIIPNSVTSIGVHAFSMCGGLTYVSIPNSVTSIGNNAFSVCRKLPSITIPSSVTSIGTGAFKCCDDLTEITVDSGNAVYHSAGNCIIETAAKTLIVGCKNTVIPTDGSVTTIGEAAFDGCFELRSITIPNSVTSIGNNAFDACVKLTDITIPNSVTSIGEYAFDECDALENITVESGNKVYHSAGNCLIETATKTLILGCKNSVIPSDGSVTEIGECAFRNNPTNMTIPDGVIKIGEHVFSFTPITSITIAKSVKSIGADAFWSCSRLSSIVFEGTKAEWDRIQKGQDWNSYTGDYTVQCTDGTLDKNGNEIASSVTLP